MRGSQCNQQMHVIRDAADPMWLALESVDYATKIFVQSGADGGSDQRLTVLRAEDQMIVQSEIRGHTRTLKIRDRESMVE